MQPPHPPASLPNSRVCVSLLLSFDLESLFNCLIFFLVQWSTQPDFNPLGHGGEVEVRDAACRRSSGGGGGGGEELNEVRVTVSDCPVNAKCYFRVAAGNLSGYGQFKSTLPSSVQLSGLILPHFHSYS